MEIKIVYEDQNFIVINKPTGLLVHGIKNVDRHNSADSEATLADWLVKIYPELKNIGDEPVVRPGIVHRLDKDTSGVMVIARTPISFEYLKKLFQNHQVVKTYLALVFGDVTPVVGSIDKPIGLQNGTVRHTVWPKSAKMIKPAKTDYKVLKRLSFNNQIFSLLELKPLTGRTHQIRVHLHSIGHPIVGDKIYGASKIRSQLAHALNLARIFLHAESIEFVDLSGKRLKFSVGLPVDLEQVLSSASVVLADRH